MFKSIAHVVEISLVESLDNKCLESCLEVKPFDL